MTSCSGVYDYALMCVQSLLKAIALFAGSVVIMRNFGDAFAV